MAVLPNLFVDNVLSGREGCMSWTEMLVSHLDLALAPSHGACEQEDAGDGQRGSSGCPVCVTGCGSRPRCSEAGVALADSRANGGRPQANCALQQGVQLWSRDASTSTLEGEAALRWLRTVDGT